MRVQLVPTNNLDQLTPILKEADDDLARIASSVEDAANTSYLVMDETICVGAVMMQWHPAESEILYIAMVQAYRGRGYGKACIEQIRDEAQHRHTDSLIVGTANSSLGNIAFYQKCGFRIDSIRKDFFSYKPAPVYEDGIQIRDMLMLRMEIH